MARNIRVGLNTKPDDSPNTLYVPLGPADYARPGLHGLTLLVRAAPGADALGAVRREISAMDEKLTPFNARSMPDQIDEMMFPVKVALYTYGFIGVFGLILAAVGLAGVTAYSVTQRRREIGIRVALGAQKRDVMGLVMKESAVLITIGSVIGLLGARAGIRLLAGVPEHHCADCRHQHVGSVSADRRPAAAGASGAALVLRAGAEIDARRSGGGAAAGVA